MKSEAHEDLDIFKQIKAFVYLNKLRVKYKKEKGQKLAINFAHRLRFSVIRRRNQRLQLTHLLSNARTDLDR